MRLIKVYNTHKICPIYMAGDKPCQTKTLLVKEYEE